MSVLTSSIWFALLLPAYCGFRLHYRKNPLEFLYHSEVQSLPEDNRKSKFRQADEAGAEKEEAFEGLDDETEDLLVGHFCGWWLYFFSFSFPSGAIFGALPIVVGFYLNWPYRRHDPSKEDWLLFLLLFYAYGMASTCLHYAFWTTELHPNVSKGIFAVTLLIVLSVVLSVMSWGGIVAVLALTCAAWFMFKVRKAKLPTQTMELRG
ncbi:hypothetical protein M3Y99_01372200 [Aphelenchoides fujianensis]|nr:hypothetical protein M3Y99_01372200 [Aphelenchoides fujianensis]